MLVNIDLYIYILYLIQINAVFILEFRQLNYKENQVQYTVKLVHVVTSIKQSPVLRGQLWDKEKVTF